MAKLKSSPHAKTATSQAKSITISNKIYFTFSSLFPHQFRQEYHDLIALEFEEQCRDAYKQHGPYGLIKLWWRALGDLTKGVIIESLKASHRKKAIIEGEGQRRRKSIDIMARFLILLNSLIAAFIILKFSFYLGLSFLCLSFVFFIITKRIKSLRPTLNPPKET